MWGDAAKANEKRIKDLNTELAEMTSGNFSEGIELIIQAFKDLGTEIENDSKAATILNRLTREATREALLFTAQQAAGLTIAKEQNLISRDKLKSDNERIKALEKANRIEVALANEQVRIQKLLLASSLDALDANKEKLKLDGERLRFVERIKNGEVGVAEAIEKAAAFTLSSAKGADALNDIVERIVEQEQARQGLLDKQATTIKKLSALQVQIATKNATALTREAAALRQQATERERTIEDRIR